MRSEAVLMTLILMLIDVERRNANVESGKVRRRKGDPHTRLTNMETGYRSLQLVSNGTGPDLSRSPFYFSLKFYFFYLYRMVD